MDWEEYIKQNRLRLSLLNEDIYGHLLDTEIERVIHSHVRTRVKLKKGVQKYELYKYFNGLERKRCWSFREYRDGKCFTHYSLEGTSLYKAFEGFNWEEVSRGEMS